jgi:glycosyltransferase involved in cell wall biosynthesis
MSRIGVLVSLTAARRGSVDDVVVTLLQRLDPSEFRVALAAPRALLDAIAGDLHGVPVETEALLADPWRLRDDVRRLSAFLDRVRPHVVATHTLRATMLLAPLARWRGVKVVETYYGGGEGSRRWLVPGRVISRLVAREIAVSEAARASLIRAGYPAEKIAVIPNGRDLSRFRSGIGREVIRGELGVDGTAPLVGVGGRLEPRMGHAEILEAWPSVVAEFPAARLVVIGDGALRRRLEGRVRELGLVGRVLFAGSARDLARVLDAIDLMVLPSLSDGMALTAIEASAMGRPVIATAVDGVPEVIREARTGRLVPPGDPAALSRAIRGVLRDPVGAQRMGRAARDFVLARFSVEHQVGATTRVYREVAGTPRAVRRAA